MFNLVSSGKARRLDADFDKLEFCCDNCAECVLERFCSWPNLMRSMKVSSSEILSKADFNSSANCSFSIEITSTFLDF